MPNPKAKETSAVVVPPRIGMLDMFRIVFMALCGGSVKGANFGYHGLAMAEDGISTSESLLRPKPMPHSN